MLPIQLSESDKEALAKDLQMALGHYARPDRSVSLIGEHGAERLLEEASNQPQSQIGKWAVRVLDRRIVGADWLRSPAPSATRVPRIVFFSLKGGVGRSTALCIVAAHLSRRGLRVLAVDFDLEAPGIGTMLLKENELPEFGSLDYFVEAALSNVDPEFLANLSEDSFLGASGARVTVVPAIGERTLKSPANALAKIARAYLEVPQEEGPTKTLTEQLGALLTQFEETNAYDVILIDSRAGLHETAAAAILGTGAEVLLFGLDQPQTFQSYSLLMEHLARFPIDPNDDWRERLSFVHAKASDSDSKRREAATRFGNLYAPLTKERSSEVAPERLTADDFVLEWAEDSQPEKSGEFERPDILYILEDSNYRNFDPVSDRRILDSPQYIASFGSLLDYADSVVGLDEMEDGLR